jgi:hypothetical protein
MKKTLFILLISAFSLGLSAQYSISGQWQQPSAPGVNDGELHITVNNCSDPITYFYDGLICGVDSNNIGHFYNLAPDVYMWGFIVNGQIHYYPSVTLSYPVYLQSSTAPDPIIKNKNIIDSFGFKPKN